MIHNIPEPDISPAFTIEDIHKIREYHYEVLKDATPEERAAYYSAASRRVEQEIEACRHELAAVNV
jgi:hypothetical protein